MAVIRFEANVPVELSLKYNFGKRVRSQIEGAPDQMMYSTESGDVFYVPQEAEQAISNARVGRGEPLPSRSACRAGKPTLTNMSRLLGGCMIAAIDAAALAREYAHTKGLTLQLTEESIQDLTSTAMIHLQKMADIEARYQVQADRMMERAQQRGGMAA